MRLPGLIALTLFVAACGGPAPHADEPAGPETPISDNHAPVGCASDGDALTGAGIGELRIGMPVDELARRCTIVADTVEKDSEGHDQRILEVLVGTDTVRSEVVADTLWRLTLERPVWKTADSLGVGTRLSKLLELPRPRGWVGEGNLVVVSPGHCGLSFEISAPPGARPGPDGWDAEALRQLPDTVRVTRIYVFGCDE